MLNRVLAVIIIMLINLPVRSQTVGVGSVGESYLRLLQLTGGLSNSTSMVSRPISRGFSCIDSIVQPLVVSSIQFRKSKRFYGGLLPVEWKQQWVSHHPLLANDGPMIPAKGYQTVLQAGIYGRVGPLKMQFNPEVVWAANAPFVVTEKYGSVPRSSYRKVFPGQSNIGLHAGPVGLSAATENLWWGPGLYSSLLMSNQAPGFLHFKLHTTRPLHTPIGSFEWSLISGFLKSDSTRPFDNKALRPSLSTTANRYLNGYVFSYQPRFLKGLSIGVTRAIQQYWKDVSQSQNRPFNKYLPVIFKAVKKENATNDDRMNTDQLASAFFKWHWPKAKAEGYLEFGYNDYKANNRDFVLNLPHAAAYLAGFRKGFVLADSTLMEAGVEIVQLSQTPDYLVRDAGNWYLHNGVTEGYTHQNQVLGSAHAANTQTFVVAFQKRLTRTSIQLQHAQRDPYVSETYWNDLLLAATHSRPFRRFYLTGQLQLTRSTNYGWEANRNTFQVLLATAIRYNFQ